jgi:hypothetical protein
VAAIILVSNYDFIIIVVIIIADTIASVMQIIPTPLYTITEISVLPILLYFSTITFTTTIINIGVAVAVAVVVAFEVTVAVVVVCKLYYSVPKNDGINICMLHVCKSVPILGSDARCSESLEHTSTIYLQESTRLSTVLLRQAVGCTVGMIWKNGVSADV